MRAAPCIALELSLSHRVRLLMQDYAHFSLDPGQLNAQLDCLSNLYGRATISGWQALALNGELERLVEELLRSHYDPAYLRSIERNFSNWASDVDLIGRHFIDGLQPGGSALVRPRRPIRDGG